MKRPGRTAGKAPSRSAIRITLCSALLGCVLTALLVLLLAFSLKWDWLSADRIHAANTVIKAAAACVSGLLAARSLRARVWLWAGLSGALYIALTYAVFACIEREFAFGVLFASDCIMGFTCACAAAVMRNLIGTLSPRKVSGA